MAGSSLLAGIEENSPHQFPLLPGEGWGECQPGKDGMLFGRAIGQTGILALHCNTRVSKGIQGGPRRTMSPLLSTPLLVS